MRSFLVNLCATAACALLFVSVPATGDLAYGCFMGSLMLAGTAWARIRNPTHSHLLDNHSMRTLTTGGTWRST